MALIVFSDESMFCLYASDERTSVRCRPGERHIPEYISPRHNKGPHQRVHGVGAVSHTKVYLQCRYSAQVFNQLLLPFLKKEGDMLFQQDNAHPHTTAVTQHAFVV